MNDKPKAGAELDEIVCGALGIPWVHTGIHAEYDDATKAWTKTELGHWPWVSTHRDAMWLVWDAMVAKPGYFISMEEGPMGRSVRVFFRSEQLSEIWEKPLPELLCCAALDALAAVAPGEKA